LVVKVGGSRSESGRLAETLGLLVRAQRGLVLVAGGGPFADAVRSAQAEQGFDDATAHRMALLAMHQSALMIAGLCERVVAVETLAEMRRAVAARRIPVWLPLALAGGDPLVPADWSITSDGLAARLAERLGVREVVLLKSCRVAPGRSAVELAAEGIVDPQFPIIAARAGLRVHVLGQDDETRLETLLGKAGREASTLCRSHDRRDGDGVLGGLADGKG
jgi:aspartokinase-like uncharacterized kinase